MIGADASCEVVRNTMTQWALDTTCCATVREARTLLSGPGFSLVFCEDQLPDGDYHELLSSFAKPSKSRFIVMSSTPELDDKYDEAMRLGAFEMIATPCRKSDIQWIVIRAMQEESRRGGSRRRPAPDEAGEETAAVTTNGAERDTSEGGQ
jgi:DNA-binding NtrC family response regulator